MQPYKCACSYFGHVLRWQLTTKSLPCKGIFRIVPFTELIFISTCALSHGVLKTIQRVSFCTKVIYSYMHLPVWLDARTATTVDAILKRTPGQDPDALKSICGLPINSYFSAVKLRWLLDNVPAVKTAVEEGRALFGTVDTWLLWVSLVRCS